MRKISTFNGLHSHGLLRALMALAMTMPLAPLGVWADNVAVAELSGEDGNKTLTFKIVDETTVGSYNFDGDVGNGTYKIESNQFPTWRAELSNVAKVVFEESFKDARPTRTSFWFNNATKLTSIEGLANLNTSEVTRMDYMFYGCELLTGIDVSGFNTEKVTDMQRMFNGCKGLTSLDVTNFNTAKVTNMTYMFYECSSLTSLDVSSFNTAEVTTMYGMFGGCSSLTQIDVSNFNTGNLTNMHDMFLRCSALTKVDISGFNTENVTDIRYMFYNCSALTELILGSNDFKNVSGTNREQAFLGVGTAMYPVTLTVYESFDKSVLGELSGDAYNWQYGWFKLNVVTGINSVKNGEAKSQNAPMYNLRGQRVGNSYRGVVIKNGRKTIRR